MTPARNASVCKISFSALSPTNTTNSPDFCMPTVANMNISTEVKKKLE